MPRPHQTAEQIVAVSMTNCTGQRHENLPRLCRASFFFHERRVCIWPLQAHTILLHSLMVFFWFAGQTLHLQAWARGMFAGKVLQEMIHESLLENIQPLCTWHSPKITNSKDPWPVQQTHTQVTIITVCSKAQTIQWASLEPSDQCWRLKRNWPGPICLFCDLQVSPCWSSRWWQKMTARLWYQWPGRTKTHTDKGF